MKKGNFLFLVYIIVAIGVFTSVGCKKTATEEVTDKVHFTFNKDSVIDIDGNVYHTVTIGSQVWMLEDLKTTHYSNGDPINPVAINDSVQWKNITAGAYCENSNGIIWVNRSGNLYNWYTIADKRNICPPGWHIPSNAEFDTLKKNVEQSKDRNFLSKVLKPNFGFARLYNGKYTDCSFSDNGTWWTSTEFDHASSFARLLSNGDIIEYTNALKKKTGYCIRCIKD